MRRGQAGGAAIQVLGAALLVLLLVGGLGLAESVRAATVKAQATRALAAATDSAARLDPRDRRAAEALFYRVLAANLGGAPYLASVTLLPDGGRDPVTGQALDRPLVSGRLELQYRPEYIGRWLPPVPVRLSYTALAARRKTAP